MQHIGFLTSFVITAKSPKGWQIYLLQKNFGVGLGTSKPGCNIKSVPYLKLMTGRKLYFNPFKKPDLVFILLNDAWNFPSNSFS